MSPALSDRGRKTRGTTSGSPTPHNIGLTVSNNTLRCFGRARPSLLQVQEGHSGRYFCVFPRCLAPTDSSLAENERILHPITVFLVILTKRRRFVKIYLLSISSALLRVISVMLVPPIILASSRFLPSISKGVTVV